VEKYCRAGQATDGNTTPRRRFASWITKATDTHLGYVIRIALRMQRRSGEGASMLHLYVHCLSCLIFSFVKN